MNRQIRVGTAWLLALGLVAPGSAGCYTRLTTPKEAINYLDPKGRVIGSDRATAILAPDYNLAVQQLGIELTEYRMQPGTRVSVEVYGYAINTSVNIRPDGMIDLPLIGDVQARGRTVSELKQEIAARYGEYFVNPPQVIVNTVTSEQDSTVRGGDVTVLNPTGGQGVVNLTGDEKLSEVLARINALHPKSEWNEIAVIREGRKEKQRYIVICDIERLVRYGDLDQDLAMRNGDIVFVPFEKNTLLEEIYASLGLLAQTFSDQQSIIDYIERLEAF